MRGPAREAGLGGGREPQGWEVCSELVWGATGGWDWPGFLVDRVQRVL